MIKILWSFCLLTLFASCEKQSLLLPRKQELRTSLNGDIPTLDPQSATDPVSKALLRLLFTGLTYTDRNGVTQLGLAQSYSLSQDGKTYTFFLKESFWSDGSPLTAYDFEKGRAIDARTIVIELKTPNTNFLNTLADPAYYPIHKNSSKTHPISCGPFKVQSYSPKDLLIIEKNNHYWDVENIRLEKIYFYIVKDAVTSLMMFDHGKLDWVGTPFTEITTGILPALEKSGVLTMRPAPFIQQPYLKDACCLGDFRWAYLTTEPDQHHRRAKGGIW